MISTIISLAIQLWLRSQVEYGEDLQVKVAGGDRQILSGYVPRVLISARNVIYQGLHLSQIHLVGKEIRLNLNQVLRGKPFQLLEPIPVDVSLVLREADLNASLQTSLLTTALAEILNTLLRVGGSTNLTVVVEKQPISLENPRILINADQLTLDTTIVSTYRHPMPIVIRTGLQLANDHVLQLDSPQWLTDIKAEQGIPLQDLEGFQLDLGPEVALEELTLELEQITCRGCITVIPN